ncbi:MAG TPA: type I glutamate--ammonia ligase [Thermoclostridium sp.]|nr:type I glutamate--ammonia ligase [Thermoclostridium sp.]HPU44783.1 type I glutamate--ammonia ligase [Thermoclostridium sp.]
MEKKMNVQDVLSLARESNVEFVRLQFTDLFGMTKNVATTVNHLQDALENKFMFDGSSIDGFARIEESDMLLYPDPDTFKIFPWQFNGGREARLICDVYRPDGTPFEGDPRYILKRALKQASDMGYTFNIGPECEFFLLHTDETGRPTTMTHDRGGYFDLSPMDLGEDARRDICLALEEMGFDVHASHHETANGQHEVDFRYDEALRSADNLMTFRIIVKKVVKRHGLHATFMPKPFTDMAGSGMHINMSLARNGENVFWDSKDKYGLSREAYSFMAGIMEHIRAITAIANPVVNSYKRLVPGYEAPVYITWATKNRSPLIRIPSAQGEATRIELRSPDPSCNPYITFAVILAAGLDGIRRGLTPPAPIERNIYQLSEEERRAAGIRTLPESLYDALAALQEDRLITDTLGSHATSRFIQAKLEEWNEYKNQVHPWEIQEYLANY